MNVSFDGLRKNATRSMIELKGVLEQVLQLESYEEVDDNMKKEIAESFNDAKMFVSTFNCLHDDNVDGDFNDLSDMDIEGLDFMESE